MATLEPRGEYLICVWRDSVYPLAERLGVRFAAASRLALLALCALTARSIEQLRLKSERVQ